MRAKEQKRVFIPNISLCPTSAHYYSTALDGFRSSGKFRANQFNLEDNEHEGKVSKKAGQRLELALSWLLYHAKQKFVVDSVTGKRFSFKVNFITLTLPAKQVHSDQDISARCLGNFLDVIKKRVGVNHYIWRAEAQGNGNIHFHLVTDTYIHYEKIRQWWNQSVELLGYVSAFELSNRHRNPNSTDIHSVKHVKRLASYLSKYMCKNRAFSCLGELRIIKGELVEVLYGSKQYRKESADARVGKVVGHVLGGKIRPIESKLWYCSRSLSSQKKIIVSGHDFEFDDIDNLVSKVDARMYQTEYVHSLYGDFSEVCRVLLLKRKLFIV